MFHDCHWNVCNSAWLKRSPYIYIDLYFDCTAPAGPIWWEAALQNGSICLSGWMIFTQLKSTEANTDKCQWKVRSGVWVNPQWEATEELTQGLIEGVRLTAWLRDKRGIGRAVAQCSLKKRRRRRRKKRSQSRCKNREVTGAAAVEEEGKSTVGGSLLSLYVTDQEKRIRRTDTVTWPLFQLAFNRYKTHFKH